MRACILPLFRPRSGGAAVGLIVLLLGCATASAGPALASISPNELKRPLPDVSAESPDNSANQLGFLLYCLAALAAGHTRDALSACSAAITLDPANPAGYKLRGIAYWNSAQIPLALADLERAATLDPADAQTQGAIGAVLRSAHQTAQSIKAYSRAIALEPGASKWWNGRCWTRAVARIDLDLALIDCTKAIALDPHSSISYDSRGLVYLQLGRAREAERDYTRALAHGPEVASSLFGRGVAKLRLSDATAARDFGHALEIDPSVASAFAEYGIVVNAAYLRRAAPSAKVCPGNHCPSSAPPASEKRPPASGAVRAARASPVYEPEAPDRR